MYMKHLQITYVLVQIMTLKEYLLCFAAMCCTNIKGKKELMEYEKVQFVSYSKAGTLWCCGVLCSAFTGFIHQFVKHAFKFQLE